MPKQHQHLSEICLEIQVLRLHPNSTEEETQGLAQEWRGRKKKGGRGKVTTCILSNFELKPKPEKHFTSGCTASKIRSEPKKRKHKPQDTQHKYSRAEQRLQEGCYNTCIVLKVNHFLCSNHPNILLNLMKSVKGLIAQSYLTL